MKHIQLSDNTALKLVPTTVAGYSTVSVLLVQKGDIDGKTSEVVLLAKEMDELVRIWEGK